MKKQDFINFSKYLSIGVIATLLNIFFSWIFIDLVGMKALFSSTIIGIAIFCIKYYSFVKINLIQRKLHIFMIITISSILLYIIFTTILIDLLSVKTLIAVPAIVVTLFFLRFFAFYWTKIIKTKQLSQ